MEENQVVVELPTSEPVKGERGVIGKATAGQTIKQRWQSHALTRLSLKAYARGLAKDGDQVAKDWLAHKKGSLNQKRTDANIAMARTCAVATKTQKRKKKGEGGAK